MRKGDDSSEYFLAEGETVVLVVTGIKTEGLFVKLAIDSTAITGKVSAKTITFTHDANFSASKVNSGMFTFAYLDDPPTSACYEMSFQDKNGTEYGTMDNYAVDDNPHQPFILRKDA
jgi:hypothetical protein